MMQPTSLSESSLRSPTSQQRYIQAMELLVTVVQELSLARDLETISAIVRQAARELTQADGATFFFTLPNIV
jgi:predicted hydrolase (HD superfamily)